MLQLGSMGIAKTIGAMPYKKLDRFAKCIEGAVSLASASIIGIVVWSVMVEKPGTRIVLDSEESRSQTVSDMAGAYVFLCVVFLIAISVFSFGSFRAKLVTGAFVIFALLVNVSALTSFNFVGYLRSATVIAEAVLPTVISGIICAHIVWIVSPSGWRAFVRQQLLKVQGSLAARKNRTIQWLEPSAD